MYFSQWADELVLSAGAGGDGGNPGQAVASVPLCTCGQPSAQLTVRKAGSNKGRLFYGCAQPQGQRCHYFQWADAPVASPARAVTSDNGSTGRGRGLVVGGRGRGKKQGDPAVDVTGGYGASFSDAGYSYDRWQPF